MIRPSTCLALLSSMATLALGDASSSSAQAITNNPTDVVLRADFPQGNAQTVVGHVRVFSLNGSATVEIQISGLPENSGRFAYQIHERPVGADKSCAGTGSHFNPFGASSECEALGDDSLCEVGDLSGKHGLINTTSVELFYHDPYLSLDPSSQQYVGNKAININLENGDRLACATIKPSREQEDLNMLGILKFLTGHSSCHQDEEDEPLDLPINIQLPFMAKPVTTTVRKLVSLADALIWLSLRAILGQWLFVPHLVCLFLPILGFLIGRSLLRRACQRIEYGDVSATNANDPLGQEG